MDDYPSNSKGLGPDPDDKPVKASKEPKPEKLDRVTVGEVVRKPPTLGSKAKNFFFGDEAKSAFHYIVDDVLLPAVRNLVVDTTTKGIERAIYGEGSAPRRSYGSGPSRYSYNAPVNRDRDRGYVPFSRERSSEPSRSGSRRGRTQPVDDFFFTSKTDAEVVLHTLGEWIDRHGAASIADLNELCGFNSAYTDNDWGWTAIGAAVIRPVREGYVIDLPPVEHLRTP